MITATATRRLTAILAADVVGYSRLMGADEEGTHERFKAHLHELVDPKIREHHGRIVKTTGDGVLAEFASVVDAVRCAGAIQRAMVDRDLDLAEERRLRFRIGVNLGDVIVDSGDNYGDGVNIAVRLEGLAAPGSIRRASATRCRAGRFSLGDAPAIPRHSRHGSRAPRRRAPARQPEAVAAGFEGNRNAQARRPEPRSLLPEILAVARPGDILGHVYSAMPDGVLGADQTPSPALIDAA